MIQDLTALHKKHMANQYGISFEEDCNDSQKPDGNHMSIDQVLVAARILEKYKGEIAKKLEENVFYTALSLKGVEVSTLAIDVSLKLGVANALV